MSYHLIDIPKGTPGEISKIDEELLELKDALAQNNKVMALVELSDLIGAIKLYINTQFSPFTFEDVVLMTEATERAFQTGYRH